MGFLDRFRRQPAVTGPVAEPEPVRPPQRFDPATGRELMEGFGYKCSWLAIRTEDQAAAARALGLVAVEPASWVDGVAAAYDGGLLLVTPPLPGVGGSWVLVAGDPAEQPIERTAELSRVLGTAVHCYATWRGTGSVVWGRTENGSVQRYFSKDDGTLNAWIGRPDEVEIGLGFGRYRDASTPAEVDAIDDADPESGYEWLTADESEVETVAAAWSVAPFDLDGPAPDQPPLIAKRA